MMRWLSHNIFYNPVNTRPEAGKRRCQGYAPFNIFSILMMLCTMALTV